MPTYKATILGGRRRWPIGAPAVTERTYTADTDADAIKAAYTTEAGDFSHVTDAYVERFEQCGECGNRKGVRVKDWDNEDNEMAAMDCLFPPEEEEEEEVRAQVDRLLADFR